MKRKLGQSEFLDLIGTAVDSELKNYYEKQMGFAILIFEFGDNSEDSSGDYVSNAKREDMISVLREMADQLEKGKYIGRPIGEA